MAVAERRRRYWRSSDMLLAPDFEIVNGSSGTGNHVLTNYLTLLYANITKKCKEAFIIGVSKYDKEAGDRRYESQYPALNNPTGLRILLSDYHALKIRQYQGDYDAIVILADLETAIELANLTARQRQALTLVYGEDLTQAEAGKRMGVGQRAVGYFIEDALEEIAEIYYYWSGHGEGYTEGESA